MKSAVPVFVLTTVNGVAPVGVNVAILNPTDALTCREIPTLVNNTPLNCILGFFYVKITAATSSFSGLNYTFTLKDNAAQTLVD